MPRDGKDAYTDKQKRKAEHTKEGACDTGPCFDGAHAQKRIDDHAFPVRVKVLVPERGFENLLLDMHRWLDAEVGRGSYAVARRRDGTDGCHRLVLPHRRGGAGLRREVPDARAG